MGGRAVLCEHRYILLLEEAGEGKLWCYIDICVDGDSLSSDVSWSSSESFDPEYSSELVDAFIAGTREEYIDNYCIIEDE